MERSAWGSGASEALCDLAPNYVRVSLSISIYVRAWRAFALYSSTLVVMFCASTYTTPVVVITWGYGWATFYQARPSIAQPIVDY